MAQVLVELIVPTTADVVVPYIADSIAFAITSQYVTLDMSSAAMAMQSVKQCMSVVSTVVATDYMIRVAMDMVPQKYKDYINNALTYASDAVANVSQAANNIGSCIIEGHDSMLSCFASVNLAREL